MFGWNESAAHPKRNSTSFCFTLIVRMLNLGSKTFHLNELQSYKFLLWNSIFMSSLHLHAKSGIFKTRLGAGKKKTTENDQSRSLTGVTLRRGRAVG